jgi:hypothetical protein
MYLDNGVKGGNRENGSQNALGYDLENCLEQSAISLYGLPCGDMRISKGISAPALHEKTLKNSDCGEKDKMVIFCHILATIMRDNRNHRSGNAKAAGEPNRENSLVSCHGTCVILSIPG